MATVDEKQANPNQTITVDLGNVFSAGDLNLWCDWWGPAPAPESQTGKYTDKYLAKQFLKLFAKPSRWCMGPTAMDAAGTAVDPEAADAVRFCSQGAMDRATYVASERRDLALQGALARFDDRWDDEASALYDDASYIGVNEDHGLKAVRRVLKAIATGHNGNGNGNGSHSNGGGE